jgi:RNA polymerase sigma-70 factor (ECF subfamily)
MAAGGRLDGYHLLHSARAAMLDRLGDRDAAAEAFRRALELATNPADRRFLERRLAAVSG